ncbi:endo alpha-1,4 polygalactosaminidase [Deinococcus detaillensis]|nr:endo alpha-1,4 polygalactosaminidase [Deinococcus detaillensis]
MRRPLAVYYGPNELLTLAKYQRVIVQPGHFTAEKVSWLQQRGVQVLAYLSLGEHDGEVAAWSESERQPEWGTIRVNVTHPDWKVRVQAQIMSECLAFDGFFLDTVDVSPAEPQRLRAMLKLVRLVRKWAGPRYLMVNRASGLLHRLRGTVNGVLIESCFTSWAGGYHAYSKSELEYTALLVEQARRFNLDVYALDYADTPNLRRFALRRAAALNLPIFITNRELNLSQGYLPRLDSPSSAAHPIHSS